MEIRIKQRLLKDVRSASNGRATSIQRLAQARRQGYKIPSLEEAMANVNLTEEVEETKKDGRRSEAHAGQAGQIVTEKERRVEKGKVTKEERLAQKDVKNARQQTA